MADLDKLRKDYAAAEEKAAEIQAEKDEALRKVADTYRDKLRAANDAAADAQRLLADTEVHEALEGRSDRDAAVANIRRTGENGVMVNLVTANTGPDGTINYEAIEAGVQAYKDRASALGFDHLPFYAEPDQD